MVYVMFHVKFIKSSANKSSTLVRNHILVYDIPNLYYFIIPKLYYFNILKFF